jgi:hypothetical protein
MKGKLIIVGAILIGGGILLFPDTIEQIDIPSLAHAALDDAENLQSNPSVQDNFNNIIQIFYEKLDVLKSLFIESL